MKFYHTQQEITVSGDTLDKFVTIVENNAHPNESSKSAVIITLQLINNNDIIATVIFRRKNLTTNQFTNYVSNIKIKPGTTILDHLTVIQPGYAYCVASDLQNIIISCSYGK